MLYKNENFLSYVEFGDHRGYPILIQHGLIASIHDQYLFESLVKAGKRLIAAARPGYGESSPHEMKNIAEWGEIVSDLVDKLHLTEFDVLGMSSGAPYSYAIGYKLPEKVRKIFIFSGTPALFNQNVLSHWPYQVNKNASLSDLQKLARELFFSNLTEQDYLKNDIRDSMKNDCFGIAQDLKIRCIDWGFQLAEIKPAVLMQHSREDQAVPVETAKITADLIPNCRLMLRDGEHFSQNTLTDFFKAFFL
jgi:pimeloyl-ACP methyl ester carboxylesterase